jgi:glucose-1-phosphate cytidylyltransferase
MKTMILCGGRGIIDPETRHRIPKALLQVGGKPLIWHIMKTFSAEGFTDFILALGEGGDAIRRHFFYQHLEGRDIEIYSGSSKVDYLTRNSEENWRIKMIDTGLNANTGSRIARCKRYIDSEPFFLTYSDCLCNVDLQSLIKHHTASAKTLTVTGVQPNSRFGTFAVTGGQVESYALDARLTGIGGYINGGYMVMSENIFDHLNVFNECNLEREVFTNLAATHQVSIFPHSGYWQPIDTERDIQQVNQLYIDNKRPWLSLGKS